MVRCSCHTFTNLVKGMVKAVRHALIQVAARAPRPRAFVAVPLVWQGIPDLAEALDPEAGHPASMSSTAATDWQAVEEAITLVLRDGKLPTRSKEAIKRGLAARNDSNAVLEALCVLDSLALNCGRTFRSGFAAPKWMKRLTQCCSASPQTAPAVAQLLANWELTFR